MDIKQILGGLQNGLDLIQKLEPLAALGGPAVSGIANVIAGLAEIGDIALENINAGVVTATSTDKDQLAEIRASIQSRNNQLDKAIRDEG